MLEIYGGCLMNIKRMQSCDSQMGVYFRISCGAFKNNLDAQFLPPLISPGTGLKHVHINVYVYIFNILS